VCVLRDETRVPKHGFRLLWDFIRSCLVLGERFWTMRKERQRRDKKPLVHVGPGLIVSLVIIAALLVVRFLTPAQTGHESPSAGPIVEKPIVLTAQESLGPVPGMRFILDHARDLKLSPSQRAGIVSLRADWERVYGPKMTQANILAKSVGDYLDEKKAGRSAPVAQIEGKATPFVSLSREIATGRRQYWARAMGLVTQEQREKVDVIRKGDWAKKRKALSHGL
jgi:hypothetical protein